MPVPIEGSSNPRTRKKGRQQQRRGTSHVIDVNSQLIEAVSQEKVSVVRRLLSSGADPNACASDPASTPALMLVCGLSSPDARHLLAGLLLGSGARVDSQSSVRETALMRAAMAGDAGMCSLLLEAGAAVGKEDCNGNTALIYAAGTGDEETVRVTVEAAKQQGCDVDRRNLKGLTALLIACQRGHLSAAKILVHQGGASPSIRDLDNFTTAGEWMLKSGLYLESDLKFLFPVSRKKSYYRRQRQERGIKTLSDYISLESNSDTSVFTARKSMRNSLNKSTKLSLSPSPNEMPSPSRSMFDIPNPTSFTVAPSLSSSVSPFRKKSILPQLPTKPKPSFSMPDFKSELYHSRHLKQRQVYVAPNRQSSGFHSGALQPIPERPLERISQGSGFHSGTPQPIPERPLERISQGSGFHSGAPQPIPGHPLERVSQGSGFHSGAPQPILGYPLERVSQGSGFHSGAPQPIPGHPLERISQGSGFHSGAPQPIPGRPLERISQCSGFYSGAPQPIPGHPLERISQGSGFHSGAPQPIPGYPLERVSQGSGFHFGAPQPIPGHPLERISQGSGFHSGAPQSIPGRPLERVSQGSVHQQREDDSGRTGSGRGGKRGKHKSLPPL